MTKPLLAKRTHYLLVRAVFDIPLDPKDAARILHLGFFHPKSVYNSGPGPDYIDVEVTSVRPAVNP